MKIVGFDCETFRIGPAMLCPQAVCFSTYDGENEAIYDHVRGVEAVGDLLLSKNTTLIAHNAPFDAGILAAEKPGLLKEIFAGWADGRIRCTRVQAMLLDIASGCFSTPSNPRFYTNPEGKNVKIAYSLAALVLRYLGRHVDKSEDTWRLRYDQLFRVPIEEWPEKARRYAVYDAVLARDLFFKMFESYSSEDGFVANEIPQNQAAFCLYLMSAYGVRTDTEAVSLLRDRLVSELAVHNGVLRESGVIRANGTKDMAAIRARVEAAFAGKVVPLTEGNQVATDADTLLDSNDPVLTALAKRAGTEKILGTYIPALLLGTKVPLCANFSVLVETGRSSCQSPNLQNLPRGGDVRLCFRPRPGFWYATCDFDTAELRSLAEVCYALVGYSTLGEALKAGQDPALLLAADLLQTSYEDALARYNAGDQEVVQARQGGKIAVYGLPGMLGLDSFVAYARGFGVEMTTDFARHLIQLWRTRYPEIAGPYFKLVKAIAGPTNSGTITQIMSNRVRGNVGCTQISNGFFQSHTADYSKAALVNVSRECYTESNSPLYGSRPVLYLHDEIFCEVPAQRAAEAAERLETVMRITQQEWLPNVPAKCSAVIMKRWYKGARGVRVEGKLVPCRPEKVDGKVEWVQDHG